MIKTLNLFRRLKKAASSIYGEDSQEQVDVHPVGTLRFDPRGNGDVWPLLTSETHFEQLPALTTVAATSDHLFVTTGTGTEIPARSAKGGVNLKTQSTTPAQGDQIQLAAAASTGVIVPITAVSMPKFRTLLNITNIVDVLVSAGFNENITDPDPTATAGEGALFLFDPAIHVTTGLAAAAHNNWILAHKVNGVDTFEDTGLPVIQGVDYDLAIDIGADLKAVFRINGVVYGSASPALTSGDSVSAYIGVETRETTGATAQRDIDVRYVRVSRFPG